jgi:hypothetical protein
MAESNVNNFMNQYFSHDNSDDNAKNVCTLLENVLSKSGNLSEIQLDALTDKMKSFNPDISQNTTQSQNSKKGKASQSSNISTRSKNNSTSKINNSSSRNKENPNSNVSDMMLHFSKHFDELCKSLNEKMDTILAMNASLIEKVNEQDKIIKKLEKENERISGLEKRISSLEADKFKGEFLLSGNQIDITSADLGSHAHNLIENALDVDCDFGSVVTSVFSVSKKQILLKINDNRLVTTLFKKFRDIKPRGLFFSERLSPFNSMLAAKLRDLKRKKKIHNVYSYHGDVYYKLLSSSRGKVVHTLADFDEINSTN